MTIDAVGILSGSLFFPSFGAREREKIRDRGKEVGNCAPIFAVTSAEVTQRGALRDFRCGGDHSSTYHYSVPG